MRTIRLRRPWAFFGGGRDYRVLVDGRVQGTLPPGGTLVLPWPEDGRYLAVALDYCVSRPVPVGVAEDREPSFTVRTAFLPLAMLASLVAPDMVLTIRED